MAIRSKFGNTFGGQFGSRFIFVPSSGPDGYASVLFDGQSASDYITTESSVDFAFGTGDFTIEFWMYKIDNVLLTKSPFSFSDNRTLIGFTWDNKITYWDGLYIESSVNAVYPDRWNHIAVTRNNGTVNLWVNGISKASGVSSHNSAARSFTIGSNFLHDNNFFDGHISNLRIVKGTALYTSSFNRPRSPLTNVTNTVLLCLQDDTSVTTAIPNTITLQSFGNPSATSTNPFIDPDASLYISNVESADGQALEPALKESIHYFVTGCKTDRIWTSIKSCCILSGARTLSGSLIPLVGTAPTNGNFIGQDYNRVNGLTGDGSTKYLDTNRANNADPQDNNHMSVYVTDFINAAGGVIGSNSTTTGHNNIYHAGGNQIYWRLRNAVAPNNQSMGIGFVGATRPDASTMYTKTSVQANTYTGFVTGTPTTDNINVFRRGTSNYWEGSLTFYSVGTNLDIDLYYNRVTTLMNDISSILP